MDIASRMEDIFLSYIKEQTEEYVEKGFISEKQQHQIIEYHEEKVIREQEIRRNILGQNFNNLDNDE